MESEVKGKLLSFEVVGLSTASVSDSSEASVEHLPNSEHADKGT
jgi:hypothetical protein